MSSFEMSISLSLFFNDCLIIYCNLMLWKIINFIWSFNMVKCHFNNMLWFCRQFLIIHQLELQIVFNDCIIFKFVSNIRNRLIIFLLLCSNFLQFHFYIILFFEQFLGIIIMMGRCFHFFNLVLFNNKFFIFLIIPNNPTIVNYTTCNSFTYFFNNTFFINL